MNKLNWYFKQPVSFEDMQYSTTGVESSIRGLLKEGEQPFGVVSGYLVTPGGAMTVTISDGAEPSIAYDREGRRITPTVSSITQSIDAATDGGGTAVAGAGNERWVSIFARGGRKFTDGVVDGSLVAKRKTVADVLNALGDAEHPAGAYDATAAKEAGIDLFYIVAGTEDVIGTAVRPTLIDDGVLIADVRRTYGVTTLTAGMILLDRRQTLAPNAIALSAFQHGAFAKRDGLYNFGVSTDCYFFGNPDYSIYVHGGTGFLRKDGSGADAAHTYHRYSIPEGVNVPWPEPEATDYRQDLLCVDFSGALSVVKGVPGTLTTGTPPDFSLVLAEVQVIPSSIETVATNWPIVRRAFRRLPYPMSTQTGIIEGCRLAWKWDPTLLFGACHVVSPFNKVSFGGEVVEFAGGYDPFMKLHAENDNDHDPFVGVADYDAPYFIYICRGEFFKNAIGSHCGPVSLLNSAMPPDPATGHPAAPLRGVRGSLLPQTDCLLVGIGWHGVEGPRPVVQSDDGWFTPLMMPNESAALPHTASDVYISGAPASAVIDKARVEFRVWPGVSDAGVMSTFPGILQVRYPGHSEVTTPTREIRVPPLMYTGMPIAGSSFGLLSMTAGEFEIAAPSGYANIWCQGKWTMKPTSFHVNLPRINYGGV